MPEPTLTVPALLGAAARRRPDGLWLDVDGARTTFGELARRVEAVARGLHAHGVGPGSRVALYLGNRSEWFETQYAVAALGAWLVPLNTMLTAPELATVVGHARPDVLVWGGEVLDRDTSGRLRELLATGAAPDRIVRLDGDGADWPDGVDTWAEVLARGAAVDPDVVRASGAAVAPDDIAMIIYTSGTTGAPKGVLQTHRSLVVSMRRYAARLGLGPQDRSIFVSPLFWIHGCWHQSLVPLVAGSAIVLERRFDAGRVLRRLTEAGCTHLQGVPFHYEALLAHPDSHRYDLSGLRIVQIGGSTFSATLPARLQERAPHAEFLAAYGLSEAGQAAYTPRGASLDDVATTIGTVHEGGEARIVDPADPGVPLGPGEVGELLLRCDCVMRGYLDAPEATAAALAGGWLHTGDLARLDDRGYLTVLGRNQDAYKRAGVTVYTSEPEFVLNEHPEVRAASVVAFPDGGLGQVGVAFVVRSDEALTADALLDHVAARLARYKVPAEVRFVAELPMTPSGKVKKYELREGRTRARVPVVGRMSGLSYAVDGGVALLTFDRPEALNTFTRVMVGEVVEAFDRADADDAVRAVVVTGSGRAFCAGADLSGGEETFDLDGAAADFDPAEHMDPGGDVAMRILDARKPVIGAVNGVAAGIGATLTLPMDIRLAAQEARFGFVFTRRGLVPECASSFFLPRLVGHQTAAEWLFTGRVVGAADAHAAGLVRSVHPGGELLDAALALAREIAANTSAVGVAITRRLLWEMAGEATPRRAHRLDSEAVFRLGRSAEVREGVNAFLEKRPPRFPLSVSQDLERMSPDWAARAPRGGA